MLSRKCFIPALFLLASVQAFPQRKTFRDSVFNVGDLIKIPPVYTLGNDDGYRNDSTFKLTATFLKAHPNLVFELGAHTDSRGAAVSNYTLSARRALYVRGQLVSRYGVDAGQLQTKGYGVTRLLVPDPVIAGAKTKEEKEALHALNRRMVLKVLKIYKTLHDSVFAPGDLIRTPEMLYGLSCPWTKAIEDSLKPVAEFMQQNPSLVLEMGSHTSSQGNDRSNMMLSQSRVRMLWDYLVDSSKINPGRLRYKGYGQTDPLVPDPEIKEARNKEEKDALYALNRRTELKVLRVYKPMNAPAFVQGDLILMPQVLYNLCHPLPSNKDSLNQVADFIKQHPDLIFELGSHTDALGDAQANQELAENRAISARDYLVNERGINPNQLRSKGYGESDPVVPEATIQAAHSKEEKDQLHSMNRRMELKVLGVR